MTTPVLPQTLRPSEPTIRLGGAVQAFELALSLLYISVLLAYLVRTTPFLLNGSGSWLPALVITSAVLALVAVERWEFVRQDTVARHTAVLVLMVRTVLVEIAARVDGTGGAYFLYLSIPLRAALTFGTVAGSLLGVAIWLRFSIDLIVSDPTWYQSAKATESIVFFPIGLIFVVALARLVIAERALRQQREHLFAELSESHAQLTAYAEEVAALTREAERTRLARDIHDGLGHALTALNVQLRRARAFRERDPEQAVHALDESLRLTHTALDDVRRSVGMLRTTEELFVLEPALLELVAPLQHGGLKLNLSTEGSSAGFAPAALMALYRGAQEGLTNIQRHAHASAVELTLCCTEHEATLCLHDNGKGFDPQVRPSGESYGLQGMRERLALVGGSLTINSRPGEGTKLMMIVPHHSLAPRQPVVQTATKDNA